METPPPITSFPTPTPAHPIIDEFVAGLHEFMLYRAQHPEIDDEFSPPIPKDKVNYPLPDFRHDFDNFDNDYGYPPTLTPPTPSPYRWRSGWQSSLFRPQFKPQVGSSVEGLIHLG